MKSNKHKTTARATTKQRWENMLNQTIIPKAHFQSLRFLHKQYAKNKWTNADYMQCVPTKHIQVLTHEHTTFCSEYLTSFAKTLTLTDNELHAFKSGTGSGKTKFVTNVLQKQGQQLISVCSRVSLSIVHKNDWNLKHYSSVDAHGIGEVIQIDSLLKMKDFVWPSCLARHQLAGRQTHGCRDDQRRQCRR